MRMLTINKVMVWSGNAVTNRFERDENGYMICGCVWKSETSHEFILQMAMLIGTIMVDHFLFESTLFADKPAVETDQGRRLASSRFSR